MSNLFGKLLGDIRFNKQSSIDSAISDLWDRNDLAENAQGYKIEDHQHEKPDGTIFVELRMWKLVDATTIAISTHVDVKETFGVESLHDFHDATHPLYYDPKKESNKDLNKDLNKEPDVAGEDW